MSANNWRVCPKCLKIKSDRAEKESKRLKEAYGKVSEQEYLNLRDKVENQEQLMPETLRED